VQLNKQEAQLPQKQCISYACLSRLATDCALHWTPQLLYNFRLAKVTHGRLQKPQLMFVRLVLWKSHF